MFKKTKINEKEAGDGPFKKIAEKLFARLGVVIAHLIRLPSSHPAAPGSLPKHNIPLLQFFSNRTLNLSLHCEKDENKQKEAGFVPSLKHSDWPNISVQPIRVLKMRPISRKSDKID